MWTITLIFATKPAVSRGGWFRFSSLRWLVGQLVGWLMGLFSGSGVQVVGATARERGRELKS